MVQEERHAKGCEMSTAKDKEATAEFMAALSFEGWDKDFPDKLPDAEEVRARAKNLNRCLRASALVMTYDDERLGNICKTDDEMDMCIELVEALRDRIKLSDAEIKLLDAAASRLMLVCSRFEISLDELG